MGFAAVLRIILIMLGFTAKGIRFGSFSAWWMAKQGIVVSQSLFSLLQSFAMR